jgi:hypothetical protein
MLAGFDIEPAARPVQMGDGFDQHLPAAGEAQDDGVAEPHVLQLVPGQHGDRPRSPRTPAGVDAGDHDWQHEDLDRLVGR